MPVVTDPGEEVAIIKASLHIANHLHREDELWQLDGMNEVWCLHILNTLQLIKVTLHRHV